MVVETKSSNHGIAPPNDIIRANTKNEEVFISPSRTEESSPPLDGGLMAWLQVSAAFVLYWNTLGLLVGFGVFQAYYEETLLGNTSASAISWIGSIQAFLLMTGGLVMGPLYDLGFVQALLLTGTFLVTFGFMMASISSQYYQVLLAQGVCIGLGTSCLYIPAIALVPAYFTKQRARAMGIASVGSSMGAIIYPIVFQRLQPELGFGWTVRIIGFIALVMCCYAIVVARPRAKPSKAGNLAKSSDTTSVKDLIKTAKLLDARYIVQCIAIFFSNVAFFEPLYYLETYARSHGMHGDDLAGYLIVILNAVAIPGRIIPSYIADRLGVLDTYIGISTLTAASVFYWISVTNRTRNVIFSVLYGFFSGSIVTLAPVVLSSITDNLDVLGTRLGVVAVLKGIGSLIGPPIAGAILGTTGDFLGVQLFAGITLALTAAFAMLLRIVIRYKSTVDIT